VLDTAIRTSAEALEDPEQLEALVDRVGSAPDEPDEPGLDGPGLHDEEAG
jgi:hypothetical protein